MTGAFWGVVTASFVACFVEMVEATTIVMAVGFTRGWRSALTGAACALGALAVATAVGGYTLRRWVPQSALQLTVGCLLLIFGLQWLRKAVLRAAGLKAVHDEEAAYHEEVERAGGAGGAAGGGLDGFAFAVAFKGVFLEGTEVVFIVVTFGLDARALPAAGAGAAAAVVTVLGLAAALRRPLSMVDENLLKYAVGLLLASFGTFWTVEGLGVLRPGHESVGWPGRDLALVVLLAGWFALSRLLVTALRGTAGPGTRVADEPGEEGGT